MKIYSALTIAVSALILSGCTASSFNEMKNDKSVAKKEFTVKENYQRLYKRSIEKSRECFEMGAITAVITTDGQLYSDIKEAELFNYMTGGLGKQMRFGATFRGVSDNETNMIIYSYGANADRSIDILKRTFTGDCKSCGCSEEDKGK